LESMCINTRWLEYIQNLADWSPMCNARWLN